MTKTITTTYSSLVTLSVAGDNPTTITTAGLLQQGLYAYSLGTAWTITNAGNVLSGGIGLQSAGTVVNAGNIFGSDAPFNHVVAVRLNAGGSVTNQSTGVISGSEGIFGAYHGGGVTVVNVGSISGQNGIDLQDGGSVTNQSAGSISASGYGIFGAVGAVTVVNAGSITGSEAAVKFAAGYTNLVVVDPGGRSSPTKSTAATPSAPPPSVRWNWPPARALAR